MNKILGVVIGLLVVIACGVGGYLYMDIAKKDEVVKKPKVTDIHMPTIQTLESGKDDEKLSNIGPLYSLDQFTLNLKGLQSDDIYLKVKIDLELSIPELKNELDAKQAVIRDAIIRILSSKTYESLSSDQGKEAALDEIVNYLNSMLNDGYIKNAYITEFIIA